MQSIPFHIAYLLTRHECVILPGLGAFIVSSSEKEKASRWGIISPPENFLGFNPEIKHNDGLLADSVAKENQCSYKEANILINQYVTQIIHSLDEGKSVQIPGVGTLYSKDHKRLFQPDRMLTCNALYYGLTGFSLPYLNELQNPENVGHPKKNKEVFWIPVSRKAISYFGSITAALLMMCLIPTPLNDARLYPEQIQYASIINLSSPKAIDEEINGSESETRLSTDASLSKEETESLNQSETIHPTKANSFHYYLIVASLPNRTLAEKSIAEFQSEGFEDASILFSDGRHRIYTSCFEDKAKAEDFLFRFRKNYPAHADAWLLKKRLKNF